MARRLLCVASLCLAAAAHGGLGRRRGQALSVTASAARFGQDGGDEDGGPPFQQSVYSYAAYQRGGQQQQQQQPYAQQQQQQQPQQQPASVPNPLLKQVSTASIGALFALLIWRSLSAYELADQFASGTLRLLAVSPTVAILCANLLGFAVNIFKPTNFKNHLKAILVLNICREGVEMLYNMLMILLSSSQSTVPREAYFGRFMMSTWWLFVTMSFSKSRWVANVVLPRAYAGGGGGGGGGGGYGQGQWHGQGEARF